MEDHNWIYAKLQAPAANSSNTTRIDKCDQSTRLICICKAMPRFNMDSTWIQHILIIL